MNTRRDTSAFRFFGPLTRQGAVAFCIVLFVSAFDPLGLKTASERLTREFFDDIAAVWLPTGTLATVEDAWRRIPDRAAARAFLNRTAIPQAGPDPMKGGRPDLDKYQLWAPIQVFHFDEAIIARNSPLPGADDPSAWRQAPHQLSLDGLATMLVDLANFGVSVIFLDVRILTDTTRGRPFCPSPGQDPAAEPDGWNHPFVRLSDAMQRPDAEPVDPYRPFLILAGTAPATTPGLVSRFTRQARTTARRVEGASSLEPADTILPCLRKLAQVVPVRWVGPTGMYPALIGPDETRVHSVEDLLGIADEWRDLHAADDLRERLVRSATRSWPSAAHAMLRAWCRHPESLIRDLPVCANGGVLDDLDYRPRPVAATPRLYYPSGDRIDALPPVPAENGEPRPDILHLHPTCNPRHEAFIDAPWTDALTYRVDYSLRRVFARIFGNRHDIREKRQNICSGIPVHEGFYDSEQGPQHTGKDVRDDVGLIKAQSLKGAAVIIGGSFDSAPDRFPSPAFGSEIGPMRHANTLQCLVWSDGNCTHSPPSFQLGSGGQFDLDMTEGFEIAAIMIAMMFCNLIARRRPCPGRVVPAPPSDAGRADSDETGPFDPVAIEQHALVIAIPLLCAFVLVGALWLPYPTADLLGLMAAAAIGLRRGIEQAIHDLIGHAVHLITRFWFLALPAGYGLIIAIITWNNLDLRIPSQVVIAIGGVIAAGFGLLLGRTIRCLLLAPDASEDPRR